MLMYEIEVDAFLNNSYFRSYMNRFMLRIFIYFRVCFKIYLCLYCFTIVGYGKIVVYTENVFLIVWYIVSFVCFVFV